MMSQNNKEQWKLKTLMVLTMIGSIIASTLIFISTSQYRQTIITKLSQIIENEIIIILLSLGINYIQISLLFVASLIITTITCTGYAEIEKQIPIENSHIIDEIFEEEKEPNRIKQIVQLQNLKTELQNLQDPTPIEEIKKEPDNQLKLKDPWHPKKTKNPMD